MHEKYPNRNVKCTGCGSVHRVSEMDHKPSKDLPGGTIQICPKCGWNGFHMASPTGRPILKQTIWHYAYRNIEKTQPQSL